MSRVVLIGRVLSGILVIGIIAMIETTRLFNIMGYPDVLRMFRVIFRQITNLKALTSSKTSLPNMRYPITPMLRSMAKVIP